MFNRIIIVAFFTGFGHLINLFILKFLSSNIPKYSVAKIGEIDSFILLIVSLLGFGLQLSATRKLAIIENWKQEYYSTQSARIALSLVLMILALTGFFVFKNILFLAAPILALNGDYALYGRGLPKMGAFVSFLRVAIPAISLLLSAIYIPDFLIEIFTLSIIISYLIAGKIVSTSLKVKYFVKPKLHNLKKYVDHLDIGFASVAFIFLGLGLVNVVSFFYSDEVTAIVYLFLKFHIIFKGVRQILVQSFYRELIEEALSIKVDFIAIIAGLFYFIIMAFYNDILSTLVFNQNFMVYSKVFILLGFAGFVSSFTTSSGARLLLLNKDHQYSKNLIIAGITTIILTILLYYSFGNQPFLIALSIVVGELMLSILNIMALNERNYIIKRIMITYPIFLLSFSFLFLSLLIHNSFISVTLLSLIYLTYTFFVVRKKINS